MYEHGLPPENDRYTVPHAGKCPYGSIGQAWYYIMVDDSNFEPANDAIAKKEKADREKLIDRLLE